MDDNSFALCLSHSCRNNFWFKSRWICVGWNFEEHRKWFGIQNSFIVFCLIIQRSDQNELESWPEAMMKENYIGTDRNNLYRKVGSRRKMMPSNLYRSRSFNFKERVEKRNNMNNHRKWKLNWVNKNDWIFPKLDIQKFVLCHFKICNMPMAMGKRRTRFLH